MFFSYFLLNESTYIVSTMHRLNLQKGAAWLDVEVFYASCSGAVLAGQEAGPEMEQSSSSHPEHLEKVEGEAFTSVCINVHCNVELWVICK